MFDPGGDIEDLYRDFAKNYPLKTDDNGWDEFLQKMDAAPAPGHPSPKPGGGNPVAGIITKYGYWLATALVLATTCAVLLFRDRKENNASVSAPVSAIKNAAVAAGGNKTQPHVAIPKVTPPQADTAEHLLQADAKKNQQTAIAQTGGAKTKRLHATAETDIPVTNQNNNITQTATNEGLYLADSKKNKPVVTSAENGINKKLVPANAQRTADGTAQPNSADSASKQASNKPTEQPGLNTTNISATGTPAKQNTVAQQAGALPVDLKGAEKDSIKNGVLKTQLIGNGAVDTAASKPPQSTTTANLPEALQNRTTTPAFDTSANSLIKPQNSGAAKTPGQSTPTDSLQFNKAAGDKTMNVHASTASPTMEKHTDSAAAAIQPLVKISTRDQKYFYFGFAGGPDFSTVKFQSVQNTGSNFGMQFGVYLGKNLSIETGLLFASKKYYTSGMYFKPGVISSPDMADLQSVNVHGHYLEIPITLRYDLLHKKRFKIFVNGGFSSYFTGNQQYDFLFHRLFGYELRRVEFDELYSNIFSILHLSAGVELKLDAANALRFEPYLKLPLSGIGAGSLPITSSGFYINFTHAIF